MGWLDSIINKVTHKNSNNSTSSSSNSSTSNSQGFSSAFGNSSSSASNWYQQWSSGTSSAKSGASTTAKSIQKEFHASPPSSYGSGGSSYHGSGVSSSPSVSYFNENVKTWQNKNTKIIPSTTIGTRTSTENKLLLKPNEINYLNKNPYGDVYFKNDEGFGVNVGSGNTRIAKLQSDLRNAYNSNDLSKVAKIKKEMHKIVGSAALKQYAMPTAESTLILASGLTPNTIFAVEKPKKIKTERTDVIIKPTWNKDVYTFKSKNKNTGETIYGITLGKTFEKGENKVTYGKIGISSKSGYGTAESLTFNTNHLPNPEKIDLAMDEKIRLFGMPTKEEREFWESSSYGIGNWRDAATGKFTPFIGSSLISKEKTIGINDRTISGRMFVGLGETTDSIVGSYGTVSILPRRRQVTRNLYAPEGGGISTYSSVNPSTSTFSLQEQQGSSIPVENIGKIVSLTTQSKSNYNIEMPILPSESASAKPMFMPQLEESKFSPIYANDFVESFNKGAMQKSKTKTPKRKNVPPKVIKSDLVPKITPQTKNNNNYIPSQRSSSKSQQGSQIISPIYPSQPTMPIEKEKTSTSQKQGGSSNNVINTPFVPFGGSGFSPKGISPILPMLPKIGFGTGFGGGKKNKGWKKQKGFTPSITALSLGMTSSKQKTGGFFSGIGLRFIPTKFGATSLKGRKRTKKKAPVKKKKKKKKTKKR